LLEERKVQFNGQCASSAAPVVLAACDFLARCSHPTGANKDPNAFEPLADAAITKAIRRVLLAGMNPRQRRGKIPIEMVASAASGALYGAVKEWLHLRRRPPAEGIVPAVVGLVEPMLAPLCSADKARG
jgi:hypothetical protein